MSKKGKIIGSIIGGLVAVGAVIGAVVAFSNMQGPGPNPNPPQTQLATVQNIEYNQEDNLLTWDDVINANSYNVSVNGKETRVEDNFYTIALTDQTTEFKVQAYDTTNTYLASEWSEPLVITLQQEDSLVADVNEFADNVAASSLTLKKVIGVHAEGSHLYTTGVYERMGEDYVYTFDTDCGKTIETLEEALKTENLSEITYTDSRNLAKNYETASYMLKMTKLRENMQSLKSQEYDLSFVTNQAYEDGQTAVGVKGILKAEKANEVHYYSVDLAVNVGNYTNESIKYTDALLGENLSLLEKSFTELTGDFAEYAEELDNLQNTNTTTQDYGMSL